MLDYTGKEINMETSMDNQIDYIRQLDDGQLVERWRTIYNAAPPDCLKPWLKQLLIYQVQEHRFGGLGADVLDKLRDIETNPLLQPNPQGFVPGTKIIRSFGNVEYTLTALKVGFDLNGVFYPTLSSTIKKFTSKSWNPAKLWMIPAGFSRLWTGPKPRRGRSAKKHLRKRRLHVGKD